MRPSQGCSGAGGEERLDKSDGDGNAPEGVEVEHEEGPPGADVEERNPRVREEVHVEVEIVGIEEGLRSEGFFDEGVGCAEEQNAGPAAAGAADELADEESPTAIHGRERNERDRGGGWKYRRGGIRRRVAQRI